MVCRTPVVLVLLVAAAAAASPAKQPICGPSAPTGELAEQGVAHAKDGRYAEAEACFLLAKQREPTTAQWTNLGSLYLDWATQLESSGRDNEARRRRAQSTEAFEGSLRAEDGPPPAKVHALLAGNYHKAGQRDKAVAHLERLLLRSDGEAADRQRAHQLLDAILAEPRTAMSEKAWADHDAMAGLGSKLVAPYLEVPGKPLTDTDRAKLTRGLDLLRRVVRLNPQNWPAHWVMGKTHVVLGDQAAAHEAFKAAAAIHAYHPDVAREECLALLHLGRATAAIAVAERAVRYNPEDPGLRANLALAQLLAGNVAAAEANVALAQQTAPNDEITINLARLITEVKAGKRPRPQKLPLAN